MFTYYFDVISVLLMFVELSGKFLSDDEDAQPLLSVATSTMADESHVAFPSSSGTSALSASDPSTLFTLAHEEQLTGRSRRSRGHSVESIRRSLEEMSDPRLMPHIISLKCVHHTED